MLLQFITQKVKEGRVAADNVSSLDIGEVMSVLEENTAKNADLRSLFIHQSFLNGKLLHAIRVMLQQIPRLFFFIQSIKFFPRYRLSDNWFTHQNLIRKLNY